MIQELVSGGQTGVDRAALDLALDLGIACGGWCPKGRRAADGQLPARYPLRETASADYSERTRLNVRDSDATLIRCAGPLSGGTAYTAEIAARLGRPLRIIDPRRRAELREVRQWLRDGRIARLNLAGPREQEQPGIYRLAHGWLFELFGNRKPSHPSQP